MTLNATQKFLLFSSLGLFCSSWARLADTVAPVDSCELSLIEVPSDQQVIQTAESLGFKTPTSTETPAAKTQAESSTEVAATIGGMESYRRWVNNVPFPAKEVRNARLMDYYHRKQSLREEIFKSSGILMTDAELVKGDKELASMEDDVFNWNARLVIWYVGKKSFDSPEYPFLEQIQEGNMGLVRSIRKFDPKGGASLGTYALYWIRQGVNRGRDKQRLIKRYYIAAKYGAEIHKLMESGVEDYAEIGKRLGISAAQVERAIQGLDVRKQVSLYNKDEADWDGWERSTEPELHVPAEDMAQRAEYHWIHEQGEAFIKELSARNRMVFERRIFGNDKLEAIAQDLKVTRERVRQLEKEQRELFVGRCRKQLGLSRHQEIDVDAMLKAILGRE